MEFLQNLLKSVNLNVSPKIGSDSDGCEVTIAFPGYREEKGIFGETRREGPHIRYKANTPEDLKKVIESSRDQLPKSNQLPRLDSWSDD
jgi:hypothetical protein